MFGNSMVKHVQRWAINKRIDNKRKVYVRQFSGFQVNFMKDYMKPCSRENDPDLLTFYVGTKVLEQQGNGGI